MPAATGFRSMYAHVARSASSSSIATLLKRLSKNAPRVLPWRLASRDSGSFKHFVNQLRHCKRVSVVANHCTSFETPLDPTLGNRQRLPGLVARWEEPSPAPDDFL